MKSKKNTINLLGIILILLTFFAVGMIIKYKITNGKSVKAINLASNQNNILNGGYVAKQGGWIYYRNFSKGNFLYKIKEDGSYKTKLTNNIASYINIVDEWIYYISTDGIYKVRVDGDENKKIRDLKDDNKYKINTEFNDISNFKNEFYNLYFQGNNLYFIDYTRVPIDDGYKMLISMDTEGKNEKVHETDTNITGFIIDKDYIYFWGTFHVGGLYKMKLDDSNKSTLTKLFITNVNILNKQYYFTVSDFENPAVNGHIFTTKDEFLSKSLLEVSEYVTCLNVTNKKIYFSTIDDRKTLYKANLDGSKIEKVSTINNPISNITFDGKWVYIVGTSYDSQGIAKSEMYKVNPDGEEIKLVN
jgi:hypothetical protein